MSTSRTTWARPIALASLLLSACGSDQAVPAASAPDAQVEALTAHADTPRAGALVEALQGRFVVAAESPRLTPMADAPPPAARRPAMDAASAQRFEQIDGRLVPRFAGAAIQGAGQGAGHAAEVALAARADGAFRVADPASGIAVEVTLEGARPVTAEAAGGFVVYPAAHESGADLVARPTPDGNEDFFALPAAPARPLAYRVALSPAVAGLRLVGNALELVDAAGAPRLRLAPPWLVDSGGNRHEARVAVEGCAVDENPAAPWGRAPTPPGAAACRVTVTIAGDVAWPALLDPSWTLTGNMSIQHYQHTATLLASGKVLVAGGVPGPSKVAELYDPQSGTWAATGSLNVARYQATGTLLLTNKVLITGGSSVANTSTGIASAELYDPVMGTFALTVPMKTARYWHTASLLANGQVLAAGGADGTGLIVSTSELYDPLNVTWTATGNLSAFRFVHSAATLQSGKILIEGGYSLGGVSSTADLYDPTKGTWAATGSMTQLRQAHTSTLLGNGKVLVAGGSFFNFAMNMNVYPVITELYDPSTGLWTNTGSIATGRIFHTSTLLNSGQALVAGGFNGATLNNADLYDPAAGTWTPGLPMNVIRANHSATTLNNTTVLVAGGSTNTAELYTTLLPNGAPCQMANQCNSTFCVDGLCCNNQCAGQCAACNVALKGGICSPLKGAPTGGRMACISDGTLCGGACDGVNQAICQFPPNNTTCRMASCALGTATLSASCDGAGSCGPIVTKKCDPYVCGPNACLSQCAKDPDCIAGDYCSAMLCIPKQLTGTPCLGSNQCQSTFCVDGYCCNLACTDQCAACNVKSLEGMCSPAKGAPAGNRAACATDGSLCGGACDGVSTPACAFPGNMTSCRMATCANGIATLAAGCDGKGACPGVMTQKCDPYVCGPNACLTLCAKDADCIAGDFCNNMVCVPQQLPGAPCTTPNQCQLNFCVDGYCCNNGCPDQCGACNVKGMEGACTAVKGAPVGNRAACASDGTSCGGACDGSNSLACAYPSNLTNCRAGSCANGKATNPANCNGSGACGPIVQTPCVPYVCGPNACLMMCAKDADCAMGYYCAGGACIPAGRPGDPCVTSNQCALNFCVDGVCCDHACTDQCAACNLKGLGGTCSPTAGPPVGLRMACATDGSLCGGACDGINTPTCAYPSNQVNCRMASCAMGTATLPATCNGMGSCPAPIMQNCSPTVCGPNACLMVCAVDADCILGDFCDMQGRCVPKGHRGDPCGQSNGCDTGFCVDGLCCDGLCDGQCAACNLPNTPGICSPVSGSPVGARPACAGSGTCQGSCDGKNPIACNLPDQSIQCAPASCTNGMALTASLCDGAGNCNQSTPVTCPAGCAATDCAPIVDMATAIPDLATPVSDLATTSDQGTSNPDQASVGPDQNTFVPDGGRVLIARIQGGGCTCNVAASHGGSPLVPLVLMGMAMVAVRRRRR